jgi:hypothetical protein
VGAGEGALVHHDVFADGDHGREEGLPVDPQEFRDWLDDLLVAGDIIGSHDDRRADVGLCLRSLSVFPSATLAFAWLEHQPWVQFQ